MQNISSRTGHLWYFNCAAPSDFQLHFLFQSLQQRQIFLICQMRPCGLWGSDLHECCCIPVIRFGITRLSIFSFSWFFIASAPFCISCMNHAPAVSSSRYAFRSRSTAAIQAASSAAGTLIQTSEAAPGSFENR